MLTPLLAPHLAQISWTVRLLALAFVAVSVFMMLVILIQKPKGGGLSGAFGGTGGSDSSFVGAKVGDFLTILTIVCFVAFLLLGMGLTWAINPAENAAAAGRAAEEEAAAAAAGDAMTATPADADAGLTDEPVAVPADAGPADDAGIDGLPPAALPNAIPTGVSPDPITGDPAPAPDAAE